MSKKNIFVKKNRLCLYTERDLIPRLWYNPNANFLVIGEIPFMLLDSFAYQQALSFLPSAFAEDSQKSTLNQLLHSMPSSGEFGFESTLAPKEKKVDFHFYVPFVGDQLCQNQLSNHGVYNEQFLISHFEGMWCNVDLDNYSVFPPKFNYYLTPKKNRNDLEHLIDPLFFLFHQKKIPASLLLNAKNLIRTFIDQDFHFFYPGFMLSRNAQGIRFRLSRKTLRHVDFLEQFLKSLGIEENVSSLVRLLKEIPCAENFLFFLVDVEHMVSPKFGVEYFLRGDAAAHPKKSWDSILDFLVSENLTSKEKQEAALSWIRRRQIQYTFGPFPSDCLEYTFLYNISHIKFVYSPEKPIETKVYFQGILESS